MTRLKAIRRGGTPVEIVGFVADGPYTKAICVERFLRRKGLEAIPIHELEIIDEQEDNRADS